MIVIAIAISLLAGFYRFLNHTLLLRKQIQRCALHCYSETAIRDVISTTTNIISFI